MPTIKKLSGFFQIGIKLYFKQTKLDGGLFLFLLHRVIILKKSHSDSGLKFNYLSKHFSSPKNCFDKDEKKLILSLYVYSISVIKFLSFNVLQED